MSAKESTAPIRLFHLPGSRSERILCLLAELNLPYQLVKPDFSNKNWMQDIKSQIGSLGRFPTIHNTIVNDTGKEEKIEVCESGAIAEYLLRRYTSSTSQSLFPQEPLSDWIKILQYIHISESTFLEHGIPIRYLNESVPATLSSVLPTDVATEETIIKITDGATKLFWNKLEHNLVWLENELEVQAEHAGDGKDVYLVGGQYTVADLMVGQALDLLYRRVVSKDGESLLQFKPRTTQWLEVLRLRDAWIIASKERSV